ncbi:g10070 [Coccomyxa elongata]
MLSDGPACSQSTSWRAGRSSAWQLARFQAVLEEGHAAAGFTILISVLMGLVLGFAVATDKNLPEGYDRASSILGWTYFACWWVGWYPQLIQNYLRKSVVGISFDFSIYNFIGFLCYSTFNCMLFFEPATRRAYRRLHEGVNSAVRVNDVAFSLHCVFASFLGLLQIALYEKGGQKVSRVCWTACTVTGGLCLVYLAGVIFSLQHFSALGFLYLLSYIKLLFTIVKYLPQMWLNHKRRSTAGWNVSNALTDMSGGLFSLSQQILDAYALKDMSILTGDVVKSALGLVSIFYCAVLAGQHYFMYRDNPDKLGRLEEGEAAGGEEGPLLSGQQARESMRQGSLDAQTVL